MSVHQVSDVEPVESDVGVFEAYESCVRSYCRVFPAIFTRGAGSFLYDREGRRWLDFLSGAGALNYGHNHPDLRGALLNYIELDGVVSSLDLHTAAKKDFLLALNDSVLRPRNLPYKCQFCGPTGTNAVEAALKLARKHTGRSGIVAFSNSYHGMSAGSMAVSSSFRRRDERYIAGGPVTFLPFEGFTGLSDELGFVERMLCARGSGIAPPAAFVVETVQAEGGVNVASVEWMRRIFALSRELGSLFIVDDIQSGCGRTGTFFSFERHGIQPDIVCLSKSISGFGLPMSILLVTPEVDVWQPGEHNGTFRGFNYAFVTGAAALRRFWSGSSFQQAVAVAASRLWSLGERLLDRQGDVLRSLSGVGMILGIKARSAETASRIQQECFARGLICEICGPDSATIKLLPPLTVSEEEIDEAGTILSAAADSVSVA